MDLLSLFRLQLTSPTYTLKSFFCIPPFFPSFCFPLHLCHPSRPQAGPCVYSRAGSWQHSVESGRKRSNGGRDAGGEGLMRGTAVAAGFCHCTSRLRHHPSLFDIRPKWAGLSILSSYHEVGVGALISPPWREGKGGQRKNVSDLTLTKHGASTRSKDEKVKVFRLDLVWWTSVWLACDRRSSPADQTFYGWFPLCTGFTWVIVRV